MKVKSWWSRDPKYMGKIETSSTKLGKYLHKKVEVIIREID